MPLTLQQISFAKFSTTLPQQQKALLKLQGRVQVGSLTIEATASEESQDCSGRAELNQVASLQTIILADVQRQIDQLAALASRPLMPDKLCVAAHTQAGCLQQTRLFQDENQACDWLYEVILADGEFTAEDLPEDRLEAIDYASTESAENSYDFQWVRLD